MRLEAILEGLERREPAALARAISLVENQRDGFERVLSHVHARLRRGGTRRIGITGPPGAGKSTLTERLIQQFRSQELRVGVVAVDPTSPFTGGALLGDRVRMGDLAGDPGVFIRSMATRGSQGGLAVHTAQVCDVLDAAGFSRILIETVGVGQSELDVAQTADSTAVVLVPESGDGVQAMEIADVYVINKSDRPGADKLRQEIEVMLGIRHGNAFRHMVPHHAPPPRAPRPADGRTGGPADRGAPPSGRPPVRPSDVWDPPVIATVASRGDGVAELAQAVDRHYAYLEAGGLLAERRRQQLAQRTRAVLERAVQHWISEATRAEELLQRRLDDVADGRRSPYDVAAEILDQVKTGALG